MERELRRQSQFSTITMGSTVRLVTSVQYKYEGVVIAFNSADMTITLKNVKFMGKDGQVNETGADKDETPKFPSIGTRFESITFWLTNIKKISVLNEAKVNSEIGDIAVKEASGAEKNTSPAKPMIVNRDNGTAATNPTQENNKERRPNRRPLPPTGNPRRGRNTDTPRQAYIVYNTASVPAPVSTRGRFSVPIREAPMENRFARRLGPRSSRSRAPYTQPTRNGGLLLYLPPDLTSLYRSNGLNIIPQSNFKGPRNGARRRNYERRNGPARGVSNQQADSEVDCSKPYDFETANEELKVELAKINLNSECADGQNTPSSGDRQVGSLSNETGINYNGKTSDSGASGDSSTGIVNTGAESSTNTNGFQSLSRGEFYVREKCFFDQISRSEGGPRGPVGSGKGERGRLKQDKSRGQGGSNRPGHTGIMSHARLERQLNIETFGQSATRSIYNQRRRPTGYVSRDILVSATA
ncbi:hypothetical protein ECG_09515 [Echinococcus granulosus]|uniref:FFD TFG box motifs n=1 Tax=Echinococcus granulosus TaxID=6210 RepID=W6U4P9_ECHGR|nr:hypothetical protein EGR_09010 [Echinococcus granulosus]EUB56118.1 hypothetical protein EGR_09010 [Echinococcus granulosus]KAH9277588.1 hypothetical protein ECG_09515 [Echinococcus granulosus]